MHFSPGRLDLAIIVAAIGSNLVFCPGVSCGHLTLSKIFLENISITLRIVNPVVVIPPKDKPLRLSVPCVPRSLTNGFDADVQDFQWSFENNEPILNDRKFTVDELNGDLFISGEAPNAVYLCTATEGSGKSHKFVHTILTGNLPSLYVNYVVGCYWKSPCYLVSFLSESMKQLYPKIWAVILQAIRMVVPTDLEEPHQEAFDFNDGFMQNEDGGVEKICRTSFEYRPLTKEFIDMLLSTIACSNLECRKSLLFDLMQVDYQRELFTDHNFIKKLNKIQLEGIPEFSVNYTVTYVGVSGTCLPGFTHHLELICLPCPPGTYQQYDHDKFGIKKSSCKPCLGHRFSSSFGKVSCDRCHPEFEVNTERTSCHRKDTYVYGIKKITHNDMGIIINESEEVYYDLGSYPKEKDLLTKVLTDRPSSVALVVAINVVVFAAMVVSIVSYFVWKRRENLKRKEGKIDENKFELMTSLARSNLEETGNKNESQSASLSPDVVSINDESSDDEITRRIFEIVEKDIRQQSGSFFTLMDSVKEMLLRKGTDRLKRVKMEDEMLLRNENEVLKSRPRTFL